MANRLISNDDFDFLSLFFFFCLIFFKMWFREKSKKFIEQIYLVAFNVFVYVTFAAFLFQYFVMISVQRYNRVKPYFKAATNNNEYSQFC